jgi:hypothetical protein
MFAMAGVVAACDGWGERKSEERVRGGIANRGGVWRVLAAGVVLVALVVRVSRRTGASRREAGAPLAGDGIVSSPRWRSTRGITIDAPPRSVWPWLVQMGFPAHRAGWYTPHWLDRLMWRIGERSSDRVRPELQGLATGDPVPDSRDWSVYFTVAELVPERALVLHSTRHLLKPARAVDFTWAFILRPVGAGRSRLLIRARARYEPAWAALVLEPLIGPGDALNASVMLRGIKARAEGRRDAPSTLLSEDVASAQGPPDLEAATAP